MMIFIGEGLQVLGAPFCPRGAVMDEKAPFRTRRRRCWRKGCRICLKGVVVGEKGAFSYQKGAFACGKMHI